MPGYGASTLDFGTGRLRVDYDAAETTLEAMITALVKAGYGAVLEP